MNTIAIGRFFPLDSAGREMINTICGNLALSCGQKKIIAVTSASTGEGKTTITMSMAKTFAEANKRVIVIDADLRHSQMRTQFRMRYPGVIPGLADYLSGRCEMQDVVCPTSQENLFLVPCTEQTASPSLLFDSPRFRELLHQLAQIFDIVLVDTPVASYAIDATKIAQYCDGLALVVSYNHTKKQDLREVIAQLEKSGCPILGCIINKVKFDSIISRRRYRLLRNVKKN